jgi:hypothetical protein
MNDPSDSRPSCHVSNFKAEATCDECGAVGAFQFGEVLLCTDCYAGKGSCCPEFGKDDLWRDDESPSGNRDET